MSRKQEDNENSDLSKNEMDVLESFIFHGDEFTNNVVPRNFRSESVAEFLDHRIDQNSGLDEFIQTEKVADFYDVFEIAEKFSECLSYSPLDGHEILQSIVICRTLALIGPTRHKQFAKSKYEILLKKIDSQMEFEEIIRLHEALDLGEDSKLLGERIQQKIEELMSNKEADYSSEVAFHNFKGVIKQNLKRAEKVEMEKQAILALDDRTTRISAEVKAYLGLDYGYLEYLEPWAARRLRRETWGEAISDQEIRNDERPFKQDLAKVFREFLNDGEITSLPVAEQDSIKVQILRAIRFFDGELTNEDEECLRMNFGSQSDTLANEGFLLPR